VSTSTERILESLEAEPAGLCDDCLSRGAEITPRQQVNQICRTLKNRGVLKREKGICHGCRSTKLVNQLSRSFLIGGAPAGEKTSIGRESSVALRDPAGKLDHIRREIIGMLGQLERVNIGRRKLPERISELEEAGTIPPSVGCMMRTLNSLRNLAVYERFVPGPNEEAVIAGAWAAVQEWWGKRGRKG